MKNKYISDSLIKEAYKNNDFDQMQLLLAKANPGSIVVIYLKALAAEHGLGQDINIETAKKHYLTLYNLGNLEAGLSLANLYEKSNSTKDWPYAEEIYTEISKYQENPEIKVQADYRLLLKNEKKVLNEIYSEFDNYQSYFKKNMKLHKLEAEYYAISTNHDNLLKEELLIHRIIVLKEKCYLANKFLQSQKNIDPEEKDSVIYVLRESKEELEKLFKQTSHLKEAKIERKLFELENIITENRAKKKNNVEDFALEMKKVKDILELNPNNINAKILNARILNDSVQTIANEEKKISQRQEALDLIRAVTLVEPENTKAISLHDQIISPIIKELTSSIADNFTTEISNSLPDLIESQKSWIWGEDTKLTKEINEKAKKLSEYSTREVELLLKESDFIRDHISFKNLEAYKEKLSNLMRVNTNKLLKKVLKNKDILLAEIENGDREEEIIKDLGIHKKNLKTNIEKTIKNWSQQEANLAKKSTHKIEDIKNQRNNRDIFKEEMVEYFYNYRKYCEVLSNHPELSIDNQNKITSSVSQIGSIVAPLLGPDLGFKFNLVNTAFSWMEGYYYSLKAQSIRDTAKKFCAIGSEESYKSHERDAKARDKLNLIASRIENEYGMQLDKVDSSEIKELAIIAAEKMINHLHNEGSYSRKLNKILSSPGSVVLEYLAGSSKDNYTEENVITTLISGIDKGTAFKKEKTIKLRSDVQRGNGKGWYAEDVFDKPAETVNGNEFFVDGESDIETYGAKLVYSIDPVKREFMPQNKKSLKDDFDKHKELLALEKLTMDDAKLSEKANEEYRLFFAESSEKAKLARKSFTGALFTGITSLAALYSGSIFATAWSLGIHTAIQIPIVSGLAITSAVFPPVAVGLIVVGAVGFSLSVERGYRASKEIKRNEMIGDLKKKDIEKNYMDIDEQRVILQKKKLEQQKINYLASPEKVKAIEIEQLEAKTKTAIPLKQKTLDKLESKAKKLAEEARERIKYKKKSWVEKIISQKPNSLKVKDRF